MAKKQRPARDQPPYSHSKPKKLPSPEEFVSKLPPSQRRVTEALRNIILRAVPGVREIVKTQRKILSYHAPHYFCFIFPRAMQVHLGFEWGDRLSDPEKQLQGEGDFSPIRYLTFSDIKEVVPAKIKSMIRESASPTIIGSSRIRPVGQRPGSKIPTARPPKK